MASLTSEHQSFIDKTDELTDTAKDKLSNLIAKNLDIEELLDNPDAILESLLNLYMASFEGYYTSAIEVGTEFGEEKVKATDGT